MAVLMVVVMEVYAQCLSVLELVLLDSSCWGPVDP